MAIEAMRGENGQPMASCVCDGCARAEVVPASFQRNRGNDQKLMEGPVTRKLQYQGWGKVKKKLLCPKCENKRKAIASQKSQHTPPERWIAGGEKYPIRKVDELITSKNEEAPRQANGIQKRLIIQALEDAYDDAAKHYRNSNTDRSVADDLGDGIMPGWVSEIRKDMFGPAGNEETSSLLAEIEVLKSATMKQIEALTARVHKAVSDHDLRVK